LNQMSRDLHLQNISEINQNLVKGKLSYSDIIRSCYTRIEKTETEINAWQVIIPRDGQASLSVVGPLYGLCLGFKDIFSTREVGTLMGTDSRTWKGTTGGFDARVVSKIRFAGATIIGKNKTSEFAVHKPTNTRNPRNHKLAPGTSSSGSAAAVAAGHVSISIASQTAGSIIRPSSYCGVIGFKPTFGEIPRTGVLKTTESFDTIGIIGNSISNILSVYNLARVQDNNHPLHVRRSESPYVTKRFFHAIGPNFDNASPFLRSISKRFISDLIGDSKLFDFAEHSSIDFFKLRNCHHIVYAKELSYFLRNELRSEQISDELKHFGNFGNHISQLDYQKNLDFLKLQRINSDQDTDGAIIFALSASDEAPQIGDKDKQDSNLFWTALGLPVISLPLLKSSDGNPVGLSIIGSKVSDLELLKFAKSIFSNILD
jgi:Asp-tRNA(Asn)/Glu-tRNA(Gln) amidotransferase A subunit family amidase